MVGGAVALIISLLALSWVQEIMGGFLSIFGVDRQSHGAKITNIVVATLLMYCLDFAINTGRSSNNGLYGDPANNPYRSPSRNSSIHCR